MGTESAHILTDLRGDILFEVICQLVGCAGKHEVMPDEESSLIADIIEKVIEEVSASPYTQGVKVCLLCGFQQQIGTLSRLTG